MRSRFHFQRLALLLMALMLMVGLANAQKQDSLYKEIAHMDSLVFNAFNTRDIETFKTLFDEGLEFYHDKGGLTNYDHTISFLKSNTTAGDLRRELVKESLEVYPIPGYGAMEIGAHTFCHTEKNGRQDCGTFRFVHIWQKKDGKWKITRVISYGH